MKSRTEPVIELEPLLNNGADTADLLGASDVWLVPEHGRVVFDERGNSSWQWPSDADPFVKQDRLSEMNANDLRIVEPGEIRRCSRPWLHESERPSKEYRLQQQEPTFAPSPGKHR